MTARKKTVADGNKGWSVYNTPTPSSNPRLKKPQYTNDMAAIDKLYGNAWQYLVLKVWAHVCAPSLLDNFYDYPAPPLPESFSIANFTRRQDRLLLWRCPLPFVRRYLAEQCGLKTRWYHRIFWVGQL